MTRHPSSNHTDSRTFRKCLLRCGEINFDQKKRSCTHLICQNVYWHLCFVTIGRHNDDIQCTCLAKDIKTNLLRKNKDVLLYIIHTTLYRNPDVFGFGCKRLFIATSLFAICKNEDKKAF